MANPMNPQKNKDEGRTMSTSQTATDIKNKAQEAGTAVADKAKDMASTVTDKARGAASSVAQTAGEMASKVGDRAEDATSSVGGGMRSLAGTIRDKGPHSGMMGSATESIAETLESGGRYLQEEGLSGMGNDLVELIRRNPIPALLIGVGIGFLFARAVSSRD